MKTLNDKEVLRAKGEPHRPVRTAKSIDRSIQNRPWKKTEYGGTTPQRQYAISDARAERELRRRELAESIAD